MSPKRVSLIREAIQDLRTGRAFYESSETGVGQYYQSSLFCDIESLRLFGGCHPIRFGYHRMLSKRFPYAIYYSAENDFIRVIAVLDMRRNPKTLMQILSDRPKS